MDPINHIGVESLDWIMAYYELTEKYNSDHWESQLTLESSHLCVTASSLLVLIPVFH